MPTPFGSSAAPYSSTRGAARRQAALPMLVIAVIAACSDQEQAQSPATAVPPEPTTLAVAGPTALPTVDWSFMAAPGTDIVPKRLVHSVEQPPPPDWVSQVAALQVAAAEEVGVRHDLEFEDRLPQSGITFVHRPTPDGAADFKPNHYDHGNGVAAADVDGDGWIDLYFSSQLGRNELWRNRGDGTFEDITDEAGVAFEDRVGVSGSFGDLDNDGDPDLIVTSVRYGNALYENDGTGRFADVTDASGLEYVGHSSSADLFDYNGDGLLDVFITNVGQYTTDNEVLSPGNPFRPEEGEWYPYYEGTMDAFFAHPDPANGEPSRLYRNDGGLRFTDVTEETGLLHDAWSGDATPFDANADGWIDLYVLNMQGRDVYFENQAGTGFEDRTDEMFPMSSWGAMGAKVFDYDNDGDLDLYVTDMHSDMSEDVTPDRDHLKARMQWPDAITQDPDRSIWGNALFENNGDGTFTEVSDARGAETMWPWGFSVGDLNADGWSDMIQTTSMNFAFRYKPNTVLLNDEGRFKESQFILGVEPRRNGQVYKPWYSVNCDEEPAHMLCSGTGATGRVDVWEPYGSRTSVVFDLDGDGDLDIVTGDWNSEPQVLISDLSERGGMNYLSLSLTGQESNADGLGAVVTVTAGDDVWVKVNDGQSGYLSQSVLPVYFGLGEHTTVDEVRVEWPSGTEQVIDGPIEAGTSLEVTEGVAPDA